MTSIKCRMGTPARPSDGRQECPSYEGLCRDLMNHLHNSSFTSQRRVDLPNECFSLPLQQRVAEVVARHLGRAVSLATTSGFCSATFCDSLPSASRSYSAFPFYAGRSCRTSSAPGASIADTGAGSAASTCRCGPPAGVGPSRSSTPRAASCAVGRRSAAGRCPCRRSCARGSSAPAQLGERRQHVDRHRRLAADRAGGDLAGPAQ